MTTQLEPFRPAWWLPGAHAQTIGGRFLRRLDDRPLLVERVELPDGDFVDLHRIEDGLPQDAPVAIVLHGLEGSARANYVATVARELAEQGIRTVRLNFRACSGEMNRLARFYHAGETGDLDLVIRRLRSLSPGFPLGLVGFSLGGNVLLKYLGERGAAAADDLSAAVAVSVPYDLSAGAGRLESPGMGWIYTAYFLRKLRRKARAKRPLLAEACDVQSALAARSVREYDEAVTAKLHGFRDASHYYEASSSRGWVEAIRIPTLLIHALDDPFLPRESVPADSLGRNSYLMDGITATGGHVGFVSGAPWRPVFWAERQAARFLAAHLHGSESLRSTIPADTPQKR